MSAEKKPKKRKAAGPKPGSRDAVILSALNLAARQGWAHVGLADIAAEAGIKLADLRAQVEDKTDILCALGRMIDRKVLERIGGYGPETPPRDRLFDVFMERFDALNVHRDGIVAVLHSFRSDPKQAVIGLPHLCRSVSWMLEAAGLDTGGIRGAVKVAAFTGLYLKVLRVWRKDDSIDLAKTMAALDRELGRAEKLAGGLGFGRF